MIKKKQNAVKVSVVLALAVSITIFPVAVGSEQREEIRAICGYIPGCDAAEVFPSPDVVREKYHMTNAEVADELVAISKMYGVGDTNECNRLIREGAITFIGRYGSTNNLPYLATIMTNRLDYAQKSAVGASFSVLRSSPDLTSFSSSIVTNAMMYSADIRNWVYSLMYGLCAEGKDDGYINNPAQHARIAAFFIEMAGAEQDLSFGIDYYACELNPWYRHSQQRRANLATLRPPGLTGRPAEIYDAAQRDAAQEDSP